MKNIIKDIKTNCRNCTPEAIVEYLWNSGDFSYTSEFYREVWYFYQNSLSLFTGIDRKRKARNHTCEMMGISQSTFRVIRKRFKEIT